MKPSERWAFFLKRETWLKALEVPIAESLAWLARVLSGVRVVYVDYVPQLRQRLYYFNHTSHADSVLLWSCLPRDVRASVHMIAAEDYWSSSWLRRYMSQRVFKAALVSRHASTLEERQEQVRRMVECMGREHSLIFSPEGTRSAGPEVQPFKSGLYYLCQARPDLELVPVWLDNVGRLLPKGEFLPLPLLCRVTFGRPFQMQPGELRQDFLARARQALLDLQSPN